MNAAIYIKCIRINKQTQVPEKIGRFVISKLINSKRKCPRQNIMKGIEN